MDIVKLAQLIYEITHLEMLDQDDLEALADNLDMDVDELRDFMDEVEDIWVAHKWGEGE